MLGGPRDGTRTLAAGVLSLADYTDRCSICWTDATGDACEYVILGPMQNGELLAVEV
jgi:hypothetical protein